MDNAQHRSRQCVRGAALLCALASCGDPTLVLPEQREPVVRAYLYAGQAVNDVRLSWTVPVGTDTLASQAPPINNATVTLVRGGVRYPLEKSAGDSGYYRYAGTALTVREGDQFTLEAAVEGSSITARTLVPVRPSGARVGSRTLTVPTLTFMPGGPRPDLAAAFTVVRWTRTAGSLYFVTLDNIETAPTAIDFGLPRGLIGRRRLVFPPTAADSLPINALGLPFLGRYVVNVWRVNEEYAQLYATLQQDSRDLNEPFTNISGGLGVFTAFAADTTSIVVVR